MRTLLIDADILAYRSAFWNEVALEVEPGYWTWHCDFTKVVDSIKYEVGSLLENLKADDYKLCLSDSKNFRRSISDTYKGNRQWLKRPLVLKAVREYMIDQGAIVISELEGDDVLSILATTPGITDEQIIVSIDKDMRSVPGLYYKNDTEGVISITTEQADYYHLYQTLIGDTIDGYKGASGIGPVAAEKILKDNPTWDAVVSTFLKKGHTEDEALVQARLAKILRYEDYDHQGGKPILWNPKT